MLPELVVVLTTPVNSSLPKIKSMKGINILKENRLKMMDKEINKV
jgi:hypothetical protein